jgi:hypothetical protein
VKVIGVPKLVIVQIMQQKDKLRDEWTLHLRRQGSYQEQKGESKDPDIEEALSQWLVLVLYNIKKGQCCHCKW